MSQTRKARRLDARMVFVNPAFLGSACGDMRGVCNMWAHFFHFDDQFLEVRVEQVLYESMRHGTPSTIGRGRQVGGA